MNMVEPEHGLSDDEEHLLASLRRGDEGAFVSLVESYHPAMVRLATTYVGERSVAEEVAQEAWLGVLRGVSSFEGRSRLKTWIFTILTNCAKTRGARERRTVPFSALWAADSEPDELAVDPARFRPADAPRGARHWSLAPQSWSSVPEERLLAQETEAEVLRAIGRLPAAQREVITLRDIEGLSAAETCNVLEVSETNQRVLLHRARSKVRQALEDYFA